MADQLAAAPIWLQLLISSGVGSAAYAACRELWVHYKSGTEEGSKAKDRTILALEKQVAGLEATIIHQRAEQHRQHEEDKATIERLGQRLDEKTARLEEVTARCGGVLGQMRLDPAIDEAEFEEQLPTGVRNMADLLVPPKSLPPKADPELDAGLKRFIDGVPTPVPEK